MKSMLLLLALSTILHSFYALSFTSCKGTSDRAKCMQIKACRNLFIFTISQHNPSASFDCIPDACSFSASSYCPRNCKCHCYITGSSKRLEC